MLVTHNYITNNENYVSGFGINLTIIVIINKTTKPKWSFKTGINIITQSYQRPILNTLIIDSSWKFFTIR